MPLYNQDQLNAVPDATQSFAMINCVKCIQGENSKFCHQKLNVASKAKLAVWWCQMKAIAVLCVWSCQCLTAVKLFAVLILMHVYSW